MSTKKLGFGLMRLPLMDAADQKSIDMEQLNQMVDLFMEKGFNYFDTAYPYHDGAGEAAFREAVVKRYPRDSFTITDKMPVMLIQKEEQYQQFFDEQLERCGVDYFDYYFLHSIGQAVYEAIESMDGFGFLSRKKAEGKIRHIGFSYHDNAACLDKILTEHPETELVQIQLNYVDWDDEGIEAGKCYEVCCKHGVEVAVMEPLKGGSLVQLPEKAIRLLRDYNPDASAASWGIRFAASLDQVKIVLSGMSDMAQMKDNLSYMERFEPLNTKEQEILQEIVHIIKENTAIACTACRYCTAGCPKHIPIPESFAIYNDIQRNGMKEGPMVRYLNLIQSGGKAQDCIECRQCEERCPQHLPITEYLKKVAETFSFLG